MKFEFDADFDNYRKIRKLTGLSPGAWHYLQDLCHSATLEHFFVHKQIELFGCQCRSVWCPKCSPRSETNGLVSNAIRKLNWRKVRHVVLTLNRDIDPGEAYKKIRRNKNIPKLLKKLNSKKWVWVLEFHADGYPHWHILAESPDGHMFGHRTLTDSWGLGIVWESFIKDKDHWFGICGYHAKKGYLAGEEKKHQLHLPDYLYGETAVRKFGYSATLREKKQKKEAIKEVIKEIRPRKTRTYGEKLEKCDEKTKICVNGQTWLEVPGSLQEVRQLCEEEFESLDYKTFNIDGHKVGTLFAIADLGTRLRRR